MKHKRWIVMSVIFIIALIVIIISAPKILNNVFERTTRMLEAKLVGEAPAEYEPKIRTDFDAFILAFKAKQLKREDLTKLSELIKTSNQDKKFAQQEIDTILSLIETMTGLK